MDGRETGFDLERRLVADVQVDTVDARALHLVVDRPGDDVARCQFCTFIELGMNRVPSGSSRRPPSPRTASLIRNDLAAGETGRSGGTG